MIDHDSYRVLAGRILMFVRDWPGENPPVLFLHGFTANSLAALTLSKLLVHRRRLLAPDLRGRGNSDMPFGEYGFPVHVRDVMACMDRMKINQFVVVGHSFGATLGVFLAALFPTRVAGLILIDGGAAPGARAQESIRLYYASMTYRYQTVEDYINRFKGSPLFHPWTEELEILTRSNLQQQPDGTYIRHVPRHVIDTDLSNDNNVTVGRLPELYPQIKCPVLILRAGLGFLGTDDLIMPDEVVSNLVTSLSAASSVTLVTIPDAAHTSILTIPNEKRDTAILKFLGL